MTSRYMNPTQGLRHVRKFTLRNKHTNIIAITLQYRHDLQDSSRLKKYKPLTGSQN